MEAIVQESKAAPTIGGSRFTAAIVYEIAGDVRFLSHQDELRMLTRACVRARWPIAYSQGFNPQPLLGIPLPRSVGAAGAGQWALVQLDESRPLPGLFGSLQAALAGCVTLQSVIAPLPHRRLHACEVEYHVELQSSDAALVAPRLDELMASESVSINRTYGPGKPQRRIDIRPFILALALDRDVLHMSVAVEQQRSARPTEIMEALALSTERYGHRTTRAAIRWVEDVFASPRWPAPPERNNCEHENRDQDRQACGRQT